MTEYVMASGYVGTALFSCMYVPQIYRIYKTGSGDDISICMLSIAMLGSMFSLMYGIGIASIPMIINNICSIVSLTSLMILKSTKSRE